MGAHSASTTQPIGRKRARDLTRTLLGMRMLVRWIFLIQICQTAVLVWMVSRGI